MLDVREWESELANWLDPFLNALGHKARQRWAGVYIRGLLGPHGTQERATDGRSLDAGRLRSTAQLHRQPVVGWRPAGDDPRRQGRCPGWRQGRHPGHRRCCPAQEGQPLGRRCPPVLRRTWQAGHLSGGGLPDPGQRQRSRAGGSAPVPAGRLGLERRAMPSSRCACGSPRRAHQAADRAGRTGPRTGGGHGVSTWSSPMPGTATAPPSARV